MANAPKPLADEMRIHDYRKPKYLRARDRRGIQVRQGPVGWEVLRVLLIFETEAAAEQAAWDLFEQER